jgi:ribosomal subunit interface protein
MQQEPEITFKDVPHSDAVEARVREHIAELERYYDRITACRVVLAKITQGQHKGNLYQCRIVILVPGGEIAINRANPNSHAHEDIYVAIRDAFDAARRKLQDHVRKHRGDVKVHEPPPHGRVKSLFPDHGFILMPDGQEVYFHRNAVVNSGFDKLEVGDEVRIALVEGESAAGPQATTVTPVGKHHPVP